MIEANPTTATTFQGGSTSYTITIGSISGLPVTFGVTGLPPWATAAFAHTSQTATTLVTSTVSTMSVISGTIYWYDEHGNLRPLAGVQVIAISQEGVSIVTSSNVDGTYVVWVAPGTYDVTASSDPGFIPQTHTVTVPPGGVASVDFQLQASGIPCTTCSVGFALVVIGIGLGVAAAGVGVAFALSGQRGSEVIVYGGYYCCRKHRVPLWYMHGRLWCPIEQKHLRV